MLKVMVNINCGEEEIFKIKVGFTKQGLDFSHTLT